MCGLQKLAEVTPKALQVSDVCFLLIFQVKRGNFGVKADNKLCISGSDLKAYQESNRLSMMAPQRGSCNQRLKEHVEHQMECARHVVACYENESPCGSSVFPDF